MRSPPLPFLSKRFPGFSGGRPEFTYQCTPLPRILPILHNAPRRRGLRILRFCLMAKALSLRRSSFSPEKRFPGFSGEDQSSRIDVRRCRVSHQFSIMHHVPPLPHPKKDMPFLGTPPIDLKRASKARPFQSFACGKTLGRRFAAVRAPPGGSLPYVSIYAAAAYPTNSP